MESNSVRLQSGQLVSVCRFEVALAERCGTWGAKFNVDSYRTSLIRELQSAGYHVFEPAVGALPTFLVMVELNLSKPHLYAENATAKLCWFSEKFPSQAYSAIAWHARQIEWSERDQARSEDLTD